LTDKVALIVIDALRKAAVEPAGLPLFAARAQPGLFPANTSGKQAAERVCSVGWLKALEAPSELWTLSEQGRARLLEETTPRQVLEDCVRAIESRHDQVVALKATLDSLTGQLTGLRSTIETVLPRLPSTGGESGESIEETILAALRRWQCDAADDCPLPELFRQIEFTHPGITIGGFHDALRRMHENGTIYLHPWTGPLYSMSEPVFALLTGHEVAYYVSGRGQHTQLNRRHLKLVEFT
jgi:hypothetical protein